jgi:monofunctional biosynthetic peptidoglycan transglycosylase
VLPWPVLMRWRNPRTTAFMDMRVEEAKAEGDTLRIRQDWVPLDRISRTLQRAVIVAEDARFRDHSGVDWEALREELHYRGDDDFSLLDPQDLKSAANALRYYRANREKIRGRSTITQQLAKNLYFSDERSMLRKAEEFVVAWRIEAFLSKDRILEIYLNTVEHGHGIFGVEAASRAYFGRSAANLDRDQAAAIAATLPQPLSANPKLRPGRLDWRKRMILGRMGGSGPVKTVPLDEPVVPPDTTANRRADPVVDTLPPPPPDTTVPPDTTADQATDTAARIASSRT